MALVVKNLPVNAGDIRDVCLIPGSGSSLEEGMATHSSVLVWKILWTEEPGRLQSIGSQRVSHNQSDLACTHAGENDFEMVLILYHLTTVPTERSIETIRSY